MPSRIRDDSRKASSSKKNPREKRTLLACQRCRGLKKKCRPRKDLPDARCIRCGASGDICRYLSVSDDPRVHSGQQSHSNHRDNLEPSGVLSLSQDLPHKPVIIIPRFPPPPQLPSAGITPRSPSDDGSFFFDPLQYDSPTSSPSSFHTISSGSASSLDSYGRSAAHIYPDNDPEITPSFSWNGFNIGMPDLSLETNYATSPNSYLPITSMEDQLRYAFQFGSSSTLEHGSRGSGINSNQIYAGYVSLPVAQNAYGPSGHCQNQETISSNEYIPDPPCMSPAGTSMYHISLSGQEISAWDETFRSTPLSD